MIELLKPTKIIYSKRKYISLIIEINGDFIVKAPIKANIKDITNFINQKQSWIIKKRSEQLNATYKPLEIQNNSIINLLDKDYKIILTDSIKTKLKDDEILLPNKESKDKLIKFLKRFAKNTIYKIVENISKKYNFNYTSISINSARSRWGSCNQNNKLHFTYKLMLCPLNIVEYVIIHELCHTKVKNHSSKFWDLVKNYCLNYKDCEKWLKQNRAIIEVI